MSRRGLELLFHDCMATGVRMDRSKLLRFERFAAYWVNGLLSFLVNIKALFSFVIRCLLGVMAFILIGLIARVAFAWLFNVFGVTEIGSMADWVAAVAAVLALFAAISAAIFSSNANNNAIKMASKNYHRDSMIKLCDRMGGAMASLSQNMSRVESKYYSICLDYHHFAAAASSLSKKMIKSEVMDFVDAQDVVDTYLSYQSMVELVSGSHFEKMYMVSAKDDSIERNGVDIWYQIAILLRDAVDRLVSKGATFQLAGFIRDTANEGELASRQKM